MNCAGGLADRDDDVLMFFAGDANRSCRAGAFDVRIGIDLVAIGAIDHIPDRTGDDVSVRGKELRVERRNGLFAVLFVGIRIAVEIRFRGPVASFRGKALDARNRRHGRV